MKKRNFPWSPFVRFLAVLCLVFCCVPAVKSEDEKKYVIELLEEEMHKAADLKVSMEVGTECGYDWYDAH